MIANVFLTMILLSSAVFQIDARALLRYSSVLRRGLSGPSTFEPSKSRPNSLKLARDGPSVCPVRSDAGSTMIGKRQTATPCDGGNCGINDDIIPTTFTGDNPLMEGQNVFSDPEDPSEVLTNAVSRSQIDGSANNDVADKPDVSGDSSSGNTAEGDVAPDKADTNSLEAVPDVSTVAVRQRLGDGRPIDGYPLDGCYEGPDDAYAVHRMEFLNYPEDSQWRRRNHWAILVSDLVLPLDLRYDVTPRGGKLAYQKLPAIFMRKNEIVEIGHYDFRGWLVATEGKTKEDALRWFEGIASNPTLLARASARDRVGEHITSWWTIQVLSTMDIYAMDGTQPAYWVRWT